MDSSRLLIQTASGLEKLMNGNPNGAALVDSNVAQISAAIYYQANVIAKLTSSKEFKNRFKSVIFKQIMEDFGNYIDSQARVKPKSLHHVYEWKQAGVPNARLFKLKSIDGEGISFKLTYEFLPSKTMVPNPQSKRRHFFKMKATVMEAGNPLVIRPRHAERLVFETHGYTVYVPKGKSVTVQHPGGILVKNQFASKYRMFFKGNLVNESIKRSGFQKVFNSSLVKAMKLPVSIKRVQYKFSPNVIRSMADSAVASSFGGAMI